MCKVPDANFSHITDTHTLGLMQERLTPTGLFPSLSLPVRKVWPYNYEL